MAARDASDLEKGTDEIIDFVCSICEGKNKSTEADKFCADCHDYYCSICVKFHDDVPVLKNHKILDKVNFNASSSAHFPVVPTERCEVHAHKPVDMYCMEHDAVGCSTCMVVEHSWCKEKFYVPDYVTINPNTANPNETKVQLDTIAYRLVEIQKYFIKEKKILERSKENTLRQIRQFRYHVNQLMYELEQKTVKKLHEQFLSLTNNIEALMRELQDTTTEVQSAQDGLQSAGNNMAQMFVRIKMANGVASNAQEKVKTSKKQIVSTEINFAPNPKLQSFLEEIQALGTVYLTETFQSTCIKQHFLPVKRTQTRGNSYKNWPMPSLLRIKDSITVKLKSGYNKCNITSACTLYDGSIILADNANLKLKLLDSSTYAVVDECNVPEYPWQVCAIDSTEIAVSCHFRQIIQLVHTYGKMKKTTQIHTGFNCYGLACADEDLFVSDAFTSVYMYSRSGERLRQYSKDQFGQQIFSDIRNLAADRQRNKIYVADHEKGLITLDTNLKLVSKLNSPVLQAANGVCLYNDDSVLVYGCDYSYFLLYYPDSKQLRASQKAFRGSQAICCTCGEDNQKLIIGFQSSDEIKVYDIID